MILLVMWGLIYLASLRTPALLDDADSIYGETAREMVTTGDWITPHANGIRFFDKPPLLYWTMAACYKLFGISEWSARLPLALLTLACVLAVFFVGRRWLGEFGGFFAALAGITSVGPYLFTRILIPDVLLGLWLTLAAYFFLKQLDEERPSLWSCWGFAASAGLMVMTKGLIGIVFPSAIAGLYLILTGNVRHLKKMRVFSSLAVLLAIAAPWHILVSLRNGPAGESKGFFWFYFINEHLYRYLNRRIPRDYDTVPLWLYLGMALIWAMPWSVFIVQGVAQPLRRWREWRGRLDGRDRANLFFFVWAFVTVVFFCFSTRQEYYSLPAVPAFALLIGGWLQREAESPACSGFRRSGRWASATLLAIGVLIFAVTMFFAVRAKAPAPGTDIADLLTQHPEEYALSLGHFLDLTGAAMGAFRVPLIATGMAFLLGPLINLILRRRNKTFAGNLALATMMVVLLWCVHLGYRIFAPVITSAQFAPAIERTWQPGDVIVINGDYESGSSLNFYTRNQLHILNNRTNNLWFGSLYPDCPPIFENDASLLRLWQGPNRVYLWVEEHKNPKAIEGQLFYEFARGGGKQILTNKPVSR